MNQKYLIKKIIKFCQDSYYDEYINQMDNIIQNLLDKNADVNESIENYFLDNLENLNLFKEKIKENKINNYIKKVLILQLIFMKMMKN